MSAPTETSSFEYEPGIEVLESTPEGFFAKLQKLMEDTPAAAGELAVQELNKRWRKLYLRTLLGMGAILLLFSVGLWIVLDSVGALDSRVTDQDLALARTEATIAAFEDQFAAGNAALVAQGLPPVEGPSDATPGSPEQAELITAAATATTLASLPREVFRSPDPAIIAQGVASYILANPVQVDPQLVITTVANYFAENQELFRGLPGRDGDRGPEGPPPSAEAIQAAFRDEVMRNPQLLCPAGGTYGTRDLALSNGGSTTNFGCFGPDAPLPDPDPGPTTPADPGEAEGNTGEGGAATPSPIPSGGPAPAQDQPQGVDPEPGEGEVAPQSPEPVQPPSDPEPGLLDVLGIM